LVALRLPTVTLSVNLTGFPFADFGRVNVNLTVPLPTEPEQCALAPATVRLQVALPPVSGEPSSLRVSGNVATAGLPATSFAGEMVALPTTGVTAAAGVFGVGVGGGGGAGGATARTYSQRPPSGARSPSAERLPFPSTAYVSTWRRNPVPLMPASDAENVYVSTLPLAVKFWVDDLGTSWKSPVAMSQSLPPAPIPANSAQSEPSVEPVAGFSSASRKTLTKLPGEKLERVTLTVTMPVGGAFDTEAPRTSGAPLPSVAGSV
jgi:hypothetical protein